MSAFAQTATEMLRSAERAFSGNSHTHLSGSDWATKDVVALPYQVTPQSTFESSATVSLIRLAMQEIASLRSELTAEREARTKTLTSLGNRWKEEIAVSIRSADLQLRREVSELERRHSLQLKDCALQQALLRRQHEELTRSLKVRDSERFDLQESIQSDLDHLREKVDAAVTQSSSVCIQATQQLERERASLSHRLDVELLRYVDMRREDQRELQVTKEFVREEVGKIGHHVRELVDESWLRCAESLHKSIQDPLNVLEAEVKRNKGLLLELDEKVVGFVRTCQSEGRLQTTTLADRLSALESNTAVASSRIDRAEKKSDAAFDVSTRTDAAVMIAKEAVDKALAYSQRANERVHRLEEGLGDRDTRIAHLESQLVGIASSEKLKVDIDACKRNIARVESHLDAVRTVCERDEALAERTFRRTDEFANRIEQCEKSVSHSVLSFQRAMGSVESCTARMACVEEAKVRLESIAERQEDAALRLSQQAQSQENRLRLLTVRCDQIAQEQQDGHQSISARLEGVHDMVARGESRGAAAKAEVDRLEKRMIKVEKDVVSLAGDCTVLRAEQNEQASTMQTIQQGYNSVCEMQELRDSQLAEKFASMSGHESVVGKEKLDLERRLSIKVNDVSKRTEERIEMMQDYLRDRLSDFRDSLQKQEGSSVHSADVQRTSEVHDSLQDLRRCISVIEGGIKECNEGMDELRHDFASLQSDTVTQDTFNALELHVRDLFKDVDQRVGHIERATVETKRHVGKVTEEQSRYSGTLSTIESELGQCVQTVVGHEQQVRRILQQLSCTGSVPTYVDIVHCVGEETVGVSVTADATLPIAGAASAGREQESLESAGSRQLRSPAENDNTEDRQTLPVLVSPILLANSEGEADVAVGSRGEAAGDSISEGHSQTPGIDGATVAVEGRPLTTSLMDRSTSSQSGGHLAPDAVSLRSSTESPHDMISDELNGQYVSPLRVRSCSTSGAMVNDPAYVANEVSDRSSNWDDSFTEGGTGSDNTPSERLDTAVDGAGAGFPTPTTSGIVNDLGHSLPSVQGVENLSSSADRRHVFSSVRSSLVKNEQHKLDVAAAPTGGDGVPTLSMVDAASASSREEWDVKSVATDHRVSLGAANDFNRMHTVSIIDKESQQPSKEVMLGADADYGPTEMHRPTIKHSDWDSSDSTTNSGESPAPNPQGSVDVAGGCDEAVELKATPRKIFVCDVEDMSLDDSVPQHGRETTSSSSGNSGDHNRRSSGSAARSTEGALPSSREVARGVTLKRYTDFDDSSSSSSMSK